MEYVDPCTRACVTDLMSDASTEFTQQHPFSSFAIFKCLVVVFYLFYRSIIWKPGHTNACILSDCSITWNLAIQMSVFYPIARSYRNLAILRSVFYPIARSHGNLAIQMTVFCPIARSYENLVIQMSIFYPIARSYGNLAIQMFVFYAIADDR